MKRTALHNERGVAMMMALVTMFLLAIIAGEIVYQSGVYSSVVFRQRDGLQADLLARTGLRLALFQLRATNKARSKAKAMGIDTSMVDQIWQTPLVLPPPDLPGLDGNDKSTLGAFRKSLGLDGTVSVNIQGESGRMSINQLVWAKAPDATGGQTPQCSDPNTGQMRNCTPQEIQQLKLAQGGTPDQQSDALKQAKQKVHDSYVELFNNMLEKKRMDDDKFRDKYATITGEMLVGNIQAWADPNTQNDGNNRDKMDYYLRAEPQPYSPKNAPITSDSEYHMIEGLDETLAKLVSDNFTTQQTSSLDVNKASMLLIHSLIPDLTQDALDRIDKRRTDEKEGGPFKTADDFWNFVNTLGNYSDAKQKLSKQGITILAPDQTFHAVITAHVDSTNTNKTWIADIGPLPPKDAGAPATQQPAGTPQPASQPAPGSTSTSTNTSTSTSSGDDYDSMGVVYLKAE